LLLANQSNPLGFSSLSLRQIRKRPLSGPFAYLAEREGHSSPSQKPHHASL
jgi:hypothetical protein